MDNVPHSFEAEKSIIGAILLDNSVLDNIVKELESKMFFNTTNREIYRSMIELYKKGDSIDSITILSNLQSRKIEPIDEIYLIECSNFVSSPININSHTQIVIETYMLRCSLNVSSNIQSSVEEQSKTSLEIISNSIDELSDIFKIKKKSKIVSPINIFEVGMKFLDKKRDTDFIFSYYKKLDDKLGSGFPLNNISVIAGIPGNLKSTFRSCLELNMINQNEGVITISTEQDLETEMERKISNMTKIPFVEIQRVKTLTELQIKKIEESYTYLAEECNYHIIADRGLSISSMRREIEKIMARYSIRIIFIDRFDRLTDVLQPEFKAQNISEKVAFINRIAQELEIHICLIVQINKEVLKNKKDKRPKSWYIKDSASYFEDARLIILLHRPKVYDKTIIEDILEVNISKQNNFDAGDGVDITFEFYPPTFTLKEVVEVEGRYYD